MAATTTTADALLREAHDRGYRFPATFDGFTARIGWETPDGCGRRDGQGPASARRLRSRPASSTTGRGTSSARWPCTGATALRRGRRPAREARRRRRRTRSAGWSSSRTRWTSSFRVRDGRIEEISRTHGGSRFTIVIQDRERPDGRSSRARSPSSSGTRAAGSPDRSVHGHPRRVDGVLLPAARRSRPPTTTGSASAARALRPRAARGRPVVRRRGRSRAARPCSRAPCRRTASAPRPKRPAPVETAPVLPARVKDKDGRTVVVRSVSRIVPLNGDIAEIVFALGLGDRVVGVDTSAIYPPKTRRHAARRSATSARSRPRASSRCARRS